MDFLGLGDSTESNGLAAVAMNLDSLIDFSGTDWDLKYDEITELEHTLFNKV